MRNDIQISICAQGVPWIAQGVAAILEKASLCSCDSLGELDATAKRLPTATAPDLFIRCAPSTHRPPAHPEHSGSRSAILFLSTGWAETEAAARAAGLSGYLGPGCCPRDLYDAVRIVAAGGFFYHPGTTTGPRIGPLTQRQRELLKWIGDGLTDGETAARMGISERTVRGHLDALQSRLGVERRGEVIALAARGGLSAPH